MEVSEFLQQNEVVVPTSAKELKKMLDKYIMTSDFEKSFRRVVISRSGEPMTAKSFMNFIKDNEDKIKSIHSEVNDLRTALCYVINEVIGGKEHYVKEVTAKRIVTSTTTPDYYFKGKISDVPIDIFDIVDGKANDKDKDLYKCFCNAGEHIVFVSNEMTKLIMQNNDGSLAFGNDLLSMSEGSLYDCICRSMQTEFTAYKNKMVALIAGVTSDDLDIEEKPTPVIEEILLNEVPCSFRHIITVCKRYKSDENGNVHFEGFVVKPNKKIVEHLDFDSFITALSKNFQKMTRGALKHQSEYKAFSNDLDEAAVVHWILPSEDCWKHAVMPSKWREFFHGKAEPRILQRLFWYVGAMQDARNTAEQALIVSDGGGTGKSTFMETLFKLFPESFFGFITNNTLDDHKDFALSERKAYEHHCLVLDEYDGRSINSPVFKNLIGTKTPISMAVKNKQAIEHNFKGTKMIVLSNEVSILNTHAFRRRVIPVSFTMNHKGREAFSEKDIKELEKTGKEFLNFCFKVYKQCKCVKPNGEYYVLSPEYEKLFLDGEELPMKDEIVSMKAISQDEAVSEFFNVMDYEDSDISIDFQNFITDNFDFTDNPDDTLTVRQVIDVIEMKLNGQFGDEDMKDTLFLFGDASSSMKINDGTFIRMINPKSKCWWLFNQKMKESGFKCKAIRVDGKVTKSWYCIKLKMQTGIPQHIDEKVIEI